MGAVLAWMDESSVAVAGWSLGLLLVEAGQGSGALITAKDAAEMGKIIFAVPGRIDTPSARGCHQLIKDGARLVEDIDDILQEFEQLIPDSTRKRTKRELPSRPDVPVNPNEERVLRALWQGPLDVDALARATGMKMSEISGLLLGLEMKRVIRILPGRVVELAGDLGSSLDGAT